MAPKKGIITMVEAKDSRDQAIKAGKKTNESIKKRIPYRIDHRTIILLDPEHDAMEQINKFKEQLETNRLNY